MQISDIYELMDRFEAGCITELQLEMEGIKLFCKKAQETGQVHSNAVREVLFSETATSPEKASIRQEVVSVPAAVREQYVEVTAQIAGTFYREPSPDSAPFVQVGQKVKKGDTLGLMEAMKMFSNVTSPVDGEVMEILAEDESLAEFGQVLMRLKETQNV